jgi:hypothetical protein
MREKFASFPALVIEVAVALYLIYWWLGEFRIVVVLIGVVVIAVLYRIMLLLETIVSRTGEDR